MGPETDKKRNFVCRGIGWIVLGVVGVYITIGDPMSIIHSAPIMGEERLIERHGGINGHLCSRSQTPLLWSVITGHTVSRKREIVARCLTQAAAYAQKPDICQPIRFLSAGKPTFTLKDGYTNARYEECLNRAKDPAEEKLQAKDNW